MLIKPKKAIASLILATIIVLFGITIYYGSKIYTVQKIVEHPELSDEKVRVISDMMTEQFDSYK